MSSEKNIIKGLKQLKAIKPSSSWLEKSRADLLAYYKENHPSIEKDLFFYYKPIFVTIVALFFFVVSSGGLVVYAKNSMPGDTLYTFKRLTEKIVYQFTPASQKSVLRAEMIGRRIDEVRTLVDKTDNNIFENISIEKATQELEKEILALKKDISPTKKAPVFDGDLPVRDNKRIVEAIRQRDFDIDKILARTKEEIREANLKAALDSISEVEKIFFVREDDEKDQLVRDTEPVDSAEIGISQIEQDQDDKAKVLPTAPVQLKQTDFKIDIEREAEELFKTDLIKE